MTVLHGNLKYICIWIFLLYFSSARPISAAFLDWIWSQNKNPELLTQTNGPLISVPFEYKTEDEQFLEEASKFTDLMKTSSLDICQHKVILKIKTSCFSMSEEELAKMSVNLLNCQSEVDERKIFPCTEGMSLKECTKDMDANTWNAYHLMNNRARAVCLAARKAQFQALSEMTVNKLMAAAHDQVNKMTALLEGQEKLETLTLGTLDSVEKGHIELMTQQENLKLAQKTVQDFVTFNLEQLTQEKALIAAGNKALAKMTETIKENLDKANLQLNSQAEERVENHKKLLEDLQALQKQAQDIFQKIDISTEKLLAQHEAASLRYKDAVYNLIKINDTVHYLLKIINTTRNEIDERFYWIQDFLDGTGNNLERLTSITFHIAYLLIGMLFASFLNFSTTSRAVLAAIVPLNLFVTYNHGSEKAMNFFQMTVIIFFTVLVIAIVHKLQNLFSSKIHASEPITSKHKPALNGTGDSRRHSVERSDCTFPAPKYSFSRLYHKFSFSLNQLLSFAFGWIGNKSGSTSVNPKAIRKNECINSYSEGGNRNGYHWNEYSFNRDRREVDFMAGQDSVHNRVNEWLHTKVDYPLPRPSTPSSTGSGSSKLYCSAVCRTGRRCKNISSPGRDVCHRHLSGTSILGSRREIWTARFVLQAELLSFASAFLWSLIGLGKGIIRLNEKSVKNFVDLIQVFNMQTSYLVHSLTH